MFRRFELSSNPSYPALSVVLGILLSITIGMSIWLSRWVYSQPFDRSYLENLYSLSQWSIPASDRIMSDNELYQLAGWRMVEGASPYSINPETPPAGKYLYGLSAKFLGNPHWASLGLYLGSLMLLVIAGRLSSLTWQQTLFGTAFLATVPVFALQLQRTMLDLPQLFFILLHMVGMLWYLRLKQRKQVVSSKIFHSLSKRLKHSTSELIFVLVSGLGLGLFSATKFAAFSPALVTAAVTTLVIAEINFKKKFQKQVIPALVAAMPRLLIFGGGILLGYLLPFFPGFVTGETITSWVTGEKWRLRFYLNAQNDRTLLDSLVFFVTLLSGYFTSSVLDTWTRTFSWSITWPVLMLFVTGYGLQFIRNKIQLSPAQLYLLLISGAIGVMYLIVPFSPRFFILFLPSSVLLFASSIRSHESKFRPYLLIGLIILSMGQLWLSLRPQPKHSFVFAVQEIEKQNYQDMYHHLAPESTDTTRSGFHFLLRSTDEQSKTSSLSAQLDLHRIYPWENKVFIPFSLARYTPAGTVTTHTNLEFTRVDGRWLADWDWKILGNDFTSKELNDAEQRVRPLLSYNEAEIPYPSLTLSTPPSQLSSKIAAELENNQLWLFRFQPHPSIWITPSAAEQPSLDMTARELFEDISELTDQSTIEIEARTFVDSLGLQHISIGFVTDDYDQELLSQLESHPAIRVQMKPKAFFNPLLKPEALKKLESEYPEQIEFQPGGTLSINTAEGQKNLLQNTAQPGENVTIDDQWYWQHLWE